MSLIIIRDAVDHSTTALDINVATNFQFLEHLKNRKRKQFSRKVNSLKYPGLIYVKISQENLYNKPPSSISDEDYSKQINKTFIDVKNIFLIEFLSKVLPFSIDVIDSVDKQNGYLHSLIYPIVEEYKKYSSSADLLMSYRLDDIFPDDLNEINTAFKVDVAYKACSDLIDRKLEGKLLYLDLRIHSVTSYNSTGFIEIGIADVNQNYIGSVYINIPFIKRLEEMTNDICNELSRLNMTHIDFMRKK